MTLRRITLLIGGIAAAVALFLLVRPGDEEEPGEAAATLGATGTEAEATTGTAPATATSPPPQPQPETVRVTVREGAPVDGIARPVVERGERIRIVVRADVSDHVHLHGYDVMRDVRPGAPAQLFVTADLAGVFEIELEDAGLLIAELEVRP